MRRSGVGSLVLSLLLTAALANSVSATAYSTMTYQAKWTPPGLSAKSVCVQAGMVDTARNYGQIVIFHYVAGQCSPPNSSVPSGWIGTQLTGWRDGSYCGSTGILYSTVATSAWQVWSYICSNPAGTQAFYTYAYGVYWNGNGYTYTANVRSPNQNY